jgi:hypothetical protein
MMEHIWLHALFLWTGSVEEDIPIWRSLETSFGSDIKN